MRRDTGDQSLYGGTWFDDDGNGDTSGEGEHADPLSFVRSLPAADLLANLQALHRGTAPLTDARPTLTLHPRRLRIAS